MKVNTIFQTYLCFGESGMPQNFYCTASPKEAPIVMFTPEKYWSEWKEVKSWQPHARLGGLPNKIGEGGVPFWGSHMKEYDILCLLLVHIILTASLAPVVEVRVSASSAPWAGTCGARDKSAQSRR